MDYNYYCINNKFYSINKIPKNGKFLLWERNERYGGYILIHEYDVEHASSILSYMERMLAPS